MPQPDNLPVPDELAASLRRMDQRQCGWRYRLFTLRAVRTHVAGLLLRPGKRRPRRRIDMAGDPALLRRRHLIGRLVALKRDRG